MILILTSKEVTKPKAKEFLRLLGNNLSVNGSTFSVENFERIEAFISNEGTDILISGKPAHEWSTIFPRKVNAYSGLALLLASYAKQHGIVFIDRFRSVTNDLTKLVQMHLFAASVVPVPKTYYTPSYTEKHLANAIRFLTFPIVIKQCNTSKGSGVLLAKNSAELTDGIASFIKEDHTKEVILQEFIENTFEYRIFITGTTVATAEKKTRGKAEKFRNNVHLGATEEFLDKNTLEKRIVDTAIKAAQITDIQVAGVDIVEDIHGDLFVFEVNSCPGFTLDEEISDEIRQLSLYLTSCEKK